MSERVTPHMTRPMTGRERMLTVLRGGIPDRPRRLVANIVEEGMLCR